MQGTFFEDADRVVNYCKEGYITGAMAAHSVPNIFYILRKYHSPNETRVMLRWLCTLVKVVGIDEEKIMRALDNKDFKDFEDCLQAECADAFRADYIVTRDQKDYQLSAIPSISPDIFCKLEAMNYAQDVVGKHMSSAEWCY